MKTQDVIKLFGSSVRLARALGITKQAISQWGVHVPALREYQIRELIDARPDLVSKRKDAA